VRTLLFIVSGFFVYFLLLLTTNRSDKEAVARVSIGFLVCWFIVAVGNLVLGVSQEGYSVADELPIALLIFVPPAIPAAVLWMKNRRG